MSHQVMAVWECPSCDVQGRDPEPEPRCWFCEGPVEVTARPTVRTEVMRRAVAHG
jgi:hypothetical protein